jgi:hypothetical protein
VLEILPNGQFITALFTTYNGHIGINCTLLSLITKYVAGRTVKSVAPIVQHFNEALVVTTLVLSYRNSLGAYSVANPRLTIYRYGGTAFVVVSHGPMRDRS